MLIDVFWSKYTPDRARSSLATAIWRLRQLLEPEGTLPGTFITNSAGEVGFNWQSDHWLDTRLFETQARAFLCKPLCDLTEDDIERVEEVFAVYQGELLEGLYDDWVLRERERFDVLHINCLLRLMDYCGAKSDFERGIAYGQAILRKDPLREEVHRVLMRLYMENGQRTLAVRQFAQCRELLKNELGVPPMEETVTLYQQVRASGQLSSEPAAGQTQQHDIGWLTHRLQVVRRNLEDITSALESIVQGVTGVVQGEEAPVPTRRIDDL
jgi:DNA-binding SARP family transcriptional activator